MNRSISFFALASGLVLLTGCEGTTQNTPPATAWGAGQWQPPQNTPAPAPTPTTTVTPPQPTAGLWVGHQNDSYEPYVDTQVYKVPNDGYLILKHPAFNRPCDQIKVSTEITKRQMGSQCVVFIQPKGQMQVGQTGMATISVGLGMVAVRYQVTAPVNMIVTTGVAVPVEFTGQFQ